MINGTGLHGGAWPELLHGRRPVLLVPADPGRPLLPEDGRAGRDTACPTTTGPRTGWSAVLTGTWLTIHRPGGALWFDAEIAATREWRRRIRDHRTLLLITGAFTGIFDFRLAATAGELLLLSTPVRLVGSL
ncbi:hypothetical protein AB0C76_15365 [Kitasatospora sp. NPDC048722]|uniref:hypothetical protein n=1 Tax=Kitasatospora sp. NPDC048722 TaxID=3155639 RepID=UPI0033D79897